MAVHNLWRIDAKHATVCPGCRGYIAKGAWIVKDEAFAKWVHAVCPGMDTREIAPEEEIRAPAQY
jgi:hypothetical protein